MSQEPDSLINYKDALNYWESVEPSVDGVLGGFGEQTIVPKTDVNGSLAFIRKLSSRIRPKEGEVRYGFEIGAGIGRITKNVLYKYCEKVDLLEYNKFFVDQMHVELADLEKAGKIGDIYNIGMQDYNEDTSGDKKYWMVWCQWCLNYLPDKELVKFMSLLGDRLSENGVIIAKENIVINLENSDVFDDVDSSVTRTDDKFKYIFAQAGLKIVAQEVQKGMPKELYPVKMYALKKNK